MKVSFSHSYFQDHILRTSAVLFCQSYQIWDKYNYELLLKYESRQKHYSMLIFWGNFYHPLIKHLQGFSQRGRGRLEPPIKSSALLEPSPPWKVILYRDLWRTTILSPAPKPQPPSPCSPPPHDFVKSGYATPLHLFVIFSGKARMKYIAYNTILTYHGSCFVSNENTG